MVSFYLCQSRYAGFYQVPEFITGNKSREVITIRMHVWPWSYNAHIPQQHIQELWQLIYV